MKIFKCNHCEATLYFENTICTNCGKSVGFDPDLMEMVTIEAESSRALNNYSVKQYCTNENLNSCNWLVRPKDEDICICCTLNRNIPQITDTVNFRRYQQLEIAKRRLIYQLLRAGLELQSKTGENPNGLAFDFLSFNISNAAMTGYANGVITILLEEADSVHREQIRKQLSEPYRTLIGHFRHEIGHYYWPLLIKPQHISKFREIFGDERLDYASALKDYYKNGPARHWKSRHISAYASSHPWEDWAETWAHYLHILDVMETARYAGIRLKTDQTDKAMVACPNPYSISEFSRLMKWAIALTTAGNSLNRSMGISDIYPFVIPSNVYKKLRFAHSVIRVSNREN